MPILVTGPVTITGPDISTFDVGEDSQLVAVVYIDQIPSSAGARYPGVAELGFENTFYLTGPITEIPLCSFGSDDINQDVNGDNDNRLDTLRPWQECRWKKASYAFNRLGLEDDTDFALYVPDGFVCRYWLFR